MTDRLEGIHALITGAASGIGAACARRMVRDGAQLLLADVNGDGAKTLADELRQASVQADVTPYRRHSAYARSGLPALGSPGCAVQQRGDRRSPATARA